MNTAQLLKAFNLGAALTMTFTNAAVAQRAPAPSLYYSSPNDLVLAMQDLRVEAATDGTYWCALQWDTGYMGLQQGGSGYTRHVHFSVWDPPAGGGLSTITKMHPNTRGSRFGGEGTGVVTYHPYDWQTNVTYTFGVSVSATNGGAEYKGFFYDPAKGYWRFLASIFRPGASGRMAYASSFLEDFGATGLERSGLYGNAWLKRADGTWLNPTQLYFNASLGEPGQVNYDGTVVSDMFRLATGGGTVNHTTILTWLTLSGGARSVAEPSDAAASLTISPTLTNAVVLSWPNCDRSWSVQRSSLMASNAGWETLTNDPIVVGERKEVTAGVPMGPTFFRLSDPSGDWSVGANGNLIRNGGFEEFLPGLYGTGELGAWDLWIGSGSGNAGVCTNGAYVGAIPSEGSKLFDMGLGGWVYGNSRLEQRLSLIPGQHYALTFDWGSEYDSGTTFVVGAGDLSAQLSDPGGTFGDAWIQHSASYVFTALGNDVVSFEQTSSDAWGLVLDNVHVHPTP